MKTTPTELPGVILVDLDERPDERGSLVELFHAERYAEAGVGAGFTFVQDNLSTSKAGVLRGLHFQITAAQGKLVSVTRGAIFDVAVDIRSGSPTFGRWVGTTLSAANRRQIWIPPHFAHGFLALAGGADVIYKCTDVYVPNAARAVRWDDPTLAIAWPLDEIEGPPILSATDAAAPVLDAAALPRYGA